MDEHTRRRVLAGVGAACTGLAAGCLDETSDPGSGSSGDDDTEDGGDGAGETDGGADSDDSEDPPQTIEEDPRVDEPPHEIERPEEPTDSDDDWNEHYLGEEMATEPTLEFDVFPQVGLADPALDELNDDAPGSEYWLSVLETQSELDEMLDLEFADDAVQDTLEAIDFEERVVVIVESGWGSSSVHHQWARIEDDAGRLHLHGYYTDPLVQTTDISTRYSVLTVERPDDLEYARASLTVSEDRRVHFNSTEGPISVDESD